MEELWEKETDERVRRRLMVLRSATVGTNTHRDLADIVGCTHTTVTRYLKKFEEGGFVGLLERGKPKPPETPMRQPLVLEALRKEVLEGNFRTARHIQDWLKKTYRIELSQASVYYWLKELGAKLLVPRPVHRKKDPQKSAEFPAKLEARLQEFEPIKATGRPIRIWVQDEGRIGLHTIMRRVTTEKSLDGVQNDTYRFVNAGVLSGKIRKIVNVVNGIKKEVYRCSYDEEGRVLSEYKNGVTVAIKYIGDATDNQTLARKVTRMDDSGNVTEIQAYDKRRSYFRAKS